MRSGYYHPSPSRVVFVANPGREEVFVTRDGAESYLARTYPDKAIPIFEEPETNFALADCWVYDTRWHQPHKSKEPATRIAGEPHPAALPLTEPETPPETPPKRRGRPPGSKNKVKTAPFKSPFEPAPEPPPSPCCPECTKSYTLFGHRDGCGLEDPADMFGILPVPFAEAAE